MHIIVAIIALVLALPLSQAPEFAQQYEQRLGGAIDELALVVQHFDEDSRQSDYDRATALGLMQKNSERLIRNQATRMQENIARLQRLREQQAALRNGGSVGRALTVMLAYDEPFASRTLETFVGAFSLAGVVLWAVGAALIYCVLMIVFLPLRRALTAS
jgi:hypothetical protein